MATITVDGKAYSVEDGQNLLHACLSLGLDIPYFCWHPALHSVGSCRQCAVKQFKDEDDRHGEIVMACMTPAKDGTRISIDDPDAREFRASVIEWLMLNHPHDCPVCDEGGECHLQDMTVMTGHTYRRSRFRKRTFRNQNLGPFINHEMNRCIHCYRCRRFYRDYAGGSDLDVFGVHDRLYFGRQQAGTLENEFSGNLVEICPTGVFTDKTFKSHYSRKWDLQTAPSICVHCGLGCNTEPGERYGRLRRIRNRYHHDINAYFLCDRGRFGYGFFDSGHRVRHPIGRSNGNAGRRITAADALQQAARLLADGRRVLGIGSPRASLEANFALKCLVGEENFYAGLSRVDFDLLGGVLTVLQRGPVRAAALREAAAADMVFVLGEDVACTAPRLGLALRQLVRPEGARRAAATSIPEWNDAGRREVTQQEKAPLFIAAPCATKLDAIAAGCHRADPDDLARLGWAVGHLLEPQAPGVSDLTDTEAATARRIADALQRAERPLVVSGTGCGSRAVIEAAANVAWALHGQGRRAAIVLTVPECNSLGLAMLGAGGALEDGFERASREPIDALVVLENDLFRRARPEAVRSFLDSAGGIVVIDHLEHETARRADVVLPAATFAEATGTLVNNECRAQRFFQVFAPASDVRESWRWVRDAAAAAGRPGAPSWPRLDDVLQALAGAVPLLHGMIQAAPGADFRALGSRIPRQSFRASGRTAVHAAIDVHEPRPPQDCDSPLSFSMEGHPGRPPGALITRVWAPGWNSVQALNRFQKEVAGPLLGGDPGRRLVEPPQQREVPFYTGCPHPARPNANRWRAVRLYEIFGSEELSALSPPVAERVPHAHVALSPEDAAMLGIAEGEPVDVSLDDSVVELPSRILKGLPPKTAGLPVGLPGMPYWDAATRLAVSKRRRHA